MSDPSHTITAALRQRLEPLRTQERAVKEKSYLKSDLEHLGVTVPNVRKTVKALSREHAELDRPALIALVEHLWERGVYELRLAASLWLAERKLLLQARDAKLLEYLLSHAYTWALVDLLAIEVAGHLTEHYASMAKTLDRWSGHEDFWVRRAAMLALLKPLRRGEGDFDRFGRYADSMLHEREFFIRKAIGWVLRERSKKKPDEVYEWVLPRAHKLSGLSLREAIKKLPAEHQAHLRQAAKQNE